MPASEAARNDLYNGLTELLGSERAETLMAYLPKYDPTDVARRADIDRLEGRIDRVELEIREVRAGLAAVNARLDKLFLSLLAGMFVLLAAIGGLAAAAL
jgi:hypothetical protein